MDRRHIVWVPLAFMAAIALIMSCSDSSGPTSSTNFPEKTGMSQGNTTGLSQPKNGLASTDEQFNCTNVREVSVRFSDPGYVNQNLAALYVKYVGMPPGKKVLRIWWDYQNHPDTWEDVHIGEGEIWRDDDNLFDYEGIIEHSYEGITSETTFRVRVEMILRQQTGNCARVRDVTVTPGSVETAARRYPPGVYPIPFAPEPAGGTPVPSASTCDDCTGTVPLGFNFVFFGNTYNTITISSNGFASFDPGVSQGCCTGQLIPQNDSVNNMIALNWDDLYPGGGGSVTYDTRGSAPNRRFVLTFQDTPWCCGGPGRVTTQMILYEGTNYIEVHTAYRTLRGFPRCTQGVEDATGSTAYFIPGRVAADYSLTNDAVLFSTN